MRAPIRSRTVRRHLRRAEARNAVMAEAWDVDLVRDVVVDGDVVRVSVAGELDAASAARLQRNLDALRWALFEAGMCASRPGQPRSHLLHDGEAATRRHAGGDLRRSAVGPPLLHTLCNLDPDVVYAIPA
jgi:hypothetical protein